MKVCLIPDRVLTRDGRWATDTAVTFWNGVITEVGKPATDGETIRLPGLTLLPGLVDIHTHAAVGADASDGVHISIVIMMQRYKNFATLKKIPIFAH